MLRSTKKTTYNKRFCASPVWRINPSYIYFSTKCRTKQYNSLHKAAGVRCNANPIHLPTKLDKILASTKIVLVNWQPNCLYLLSYNHSSKSDRMVWKERFAIIHISIFYSFCLNLWEALHLTAVWRNAAGQVLG